MPSKSEKQAKFMAAIAAGFKPTKTKAPPIAVAREFVKEDQKKRKRTIAEGG